MERHTCRVVIIRVLYSLDLNKQTDFTDEELDFQIGYAIDPINDVELPLNLDNYELTKNNLSFIKESIKNIILNIEEIDTIIEKNLQKYTISRFNYVDRAIIRLATYELKNKLAPSQVVINEAIELTKEYSNLDDDLQVKFNNKVLDNISKGLSNE